ncbi:alpha/beta fold hydrolase [Ruegeria halocynthiae]|uniref:alpha/beta fold hydrolase n=1 Tax=Ruegeria halocynthiae TaxID=985054 RepID=UPI00055A239A|nr:alpha/beta hydrolase [Ruegeria halocynthiae]
MNPSPTAHVRTLGQGARKVLALHCTIAHSGAWAGLSAALQGQVSLIAPDMLSHGRSPDWDGQGDYFDRVTDLAAAQLAGPMDVIGHSFGAMIALRLAVDRPELIRSAVLIEPVFFAIARQDAPDLVAQHDHAAQPYTDALSAGDMELAARLFNRMWSTDDSPRWPDLPERTRAAMVRGVHAVPAVEEAVVRDQKGLLNPGVLDRAIMPVLILSGSKTRPVMPAIGQGLQRRLPNASCACVKGAGHMLPISHPQETAHVVQQFWRDTCDR